MRQIRSVRTIMALALALALLGAPGAQAAELYFEGKVAGGETLSVLAPYGGIVEEMAVSVGERIEQGDLIAKLATTKEFAPVEGRVAGVFGQPGDNTESVTERYGAVLFIEPLHKYTISADTSKAYNSNQNRVIHTGEVVYLSCTSDGTHQGVGVVTKVENSSYTVEVTAGEFYLEETVTIYRKPDYDSKSRIGRGTVESTAAVAVKGTGSILKMHVQTGDTVERGQLLFESVSGTLDGLYAPGNEIRSEASGIVTAVDAGMGASVEKGGKLITYYPSDSMRIEIAVAEADLAYVVPGMKVGIEFNWDINQEHRMEGTIAEVSYNVADPEAEGAPMYTAYVDFTPDESVRLGMTVLVYTIDGHDSAVQASDDATADSDPAEE